uniref:Anhydro-N-acetylmuramic acid kinase n=1 Tax=Magnetococcus massalia (strain MO-1) TaxID=451514 RepID=A0A1S7LKB2_MAGMO|nr:Anhydro-N-acetylmuramic acid kinase [Candidatus Magnetococcus massalia]
MSEKHATPSPQSHLVIGLMSGTSADGIDAALVRTDGIAACEPIAYLEQPFEPSLRQRILQLQQPGEGDPEEMGMLDRILGEIFARVAQQLCQQAQVDCHSVSLIGSHGQTIRHRPPHFTTQLGAPSVIATLTGITTVGDFRMADMALGGEGAPLAPLYHQALFAGEPGAPQHQCIVNLGGIANITWLAKGATEPLLAGDTGPANALMDELALQLSDGRVCCDTDGEGARQGREDAKALAWLMGHPYLKKCYPKSTGKEDFGPAWLAAWLAQFPAMHSNHGLATLTRYTARSLAQGIALAHPDGTTPERLVLCGGGAYNPVLREMIQQEMPESQVVTCQELGVEAAQIEAHAFAWLALRTLKGLPGSSPGTTGARRSTTLGAIYPGQNWPELLSNL